MRSASMGPPRRSTRQNRDTQPEEIPLGQLFGAATRPPPSREANARPQGIRARSTTVTNPDGTFSQVINIGVPQDHPLADPNSQAGSSNLYNLRMGNIRVPPAPQFVINMRRQNTE